MCNFTIENATPIRYVLSKIIIKEAVYQLC
jgi:hypothetical protein